VKHSYDGVQLLVRHGVCDMHERNKKQEEFRLVMVSMDHSVQNILSFSLLSKHLEIKIYRIIILPVV
jgi:hypothetical protein